MTHGTQAKVEATAIAAAITVIYAVLQAIVPIIQQSYPGFQWLPVLLMLMATLGAIVPLTSKWFHVPNEDQAADTSTIAALSAVVTATAPSITTSPTPVPGQPIRPIEFGTLTTKTPPVPPPEHLLPPVAPTTPTP